MFILKPIVHETVWGGSKLTKYSGSDCQKIGHLYSAIDNKSMSNIIATGENKGKTLHDWFIANRTRYGLDKFDEVPVLMALVEAADNLSIQVHPDDKMAVEYVGKEFGKNESIFLIEPPTAGCIYNGCTVKSVEAMSKLIADGKTMVGVDTLPVQAGDYIYIKGGTLHAASAGSLSFEIEENCDATYRFYDFDRVDKNGQKRPLQVEKALKCLHPDLKSEIKHYIPGQSIEERMYWTRLCLAADEVENKTDMFVFAVVLKGVFTLEGYLMQPGTCVVLEPGDKFDATGADIMLAPPKAI